MKSVLAIILALAWGTASAKELSVDELRVIQSKMKATDSMSVDFVQTKYSKLRDKTSRREGRAIFSKPSSFKWMLEKPVQQYLVFDGKSFFEYNPGSNSAVRYSPTGPQSYDLKQIVDLVLNFDSLLKRYELKKAEQDGDLVKVELTPKTEGDVTGVELHLSQKDSYISFLKLTMKSTDYLAHDFKTPSRNKVKADAFTLPKTVKITDSN